MKNNIIKRGLEIEPRVLMSGAMKEIDYIPPERWHMAILSARKSGDQLFDLAYPDAYNGGNVGPVGMVNIIERSGYSYAYLVNMTGDWCAIGYTYGAENSGLKMPGISVEREEV